jgi:lysophospholipase
VGGIPIRYRSYPSPGARGALVILTGRSESIPKYAELIHDLRDSGYSIHIMDHRGQGLSGRMLEDPWKGHVVRFQDYLADLDRFLGSVVRTDPQTHGKVYLLAHSMGGAIAAAYAEKHPDAFTAMALCAPMFQVNSAPLEEWEIRDIADREVQSGKGAEYPRGRRGDEWRSSFHGNSVTSSPERYLRSQQILVNDPSLALGAPTFRWFREAVRLDRHLRRHAARLRTPTLILQAGADTIVRTAAHDEVCSRARDCRIVRFPDAKHEILQERDEIRDRALREILHFFRDR